jgi:hypothetical protein
MDDLNFIVQTKSYKFKISETYQMVVITRAESWRVADNVAILLYVDELVLVGALQDDHNLEIEVRPGTLQCQI